MRKGDSIKDSIFNTYLYIKNNFFTYKKHKKFNYNNYDCKLNYLFKSDTGDFKNTQYFGEINISYPWQYCSPNAVEYSDNGLKLHQRYNPTQINYWDGNTYKPDWEVGCVTSKDTFTYGLFEFNIKLPIGVGLWPAIWLTGADTWPPEIDIIECYSDENGKYDNIFNTNAYFGHDDKVLEVRARKTINISDSKLKEQTINFILIWEEDKIEYYINGFLVRKITNKKILEKFANQRMYVVLNNAIRKNFENIVDKKQESIFQILQFKYYKKRGSI